MTDEDIMRLIETPKWAEAIRIGTQNQRKREVWCELRGAQFQFLLLVRVSPDWADDFSCVLFHNASPRLILRRHDGARHPHINHLERTRFSNCFHIHTATNRYILSSYRDENFAYATDRFSDVTGALHSLMSDCRVHGLSAETLLVRL